MMDAEMQVFGLAVLLAGLGGCGGGTPTAVGRVRRTLEPLLVVPMTTPQRQRQAREEPQPHQLLAGMSGRCSC